MSRHVFDTQDDIELTATFTDPDTNFPVDPDTVTITVKKPDATTVTPSIDNPSVGVYTTTVTPGSNEYGRWWYRWRGTGQIQAAGERYFVVRRPQVG